MFVFFLLPKLFSVFTLTRQNFRGQVFTAEEKNNYEEWLIHIKITAIDFFLFYDKEKCIAKV